MTTDEAVTIYSAFNQSISIGIQSPYHNHQIKTHLQRQRTRAPSRLNPHLPRLEHHVLALHGRNLPVQSQPAQRHAAFPALRASELRQEIPLALGPSLRVVDQLVEAFEADWHGGGAWVVWDVKLYFKDI